MQEHVSRAEIGQAVRVLDNTTGEIFDAVVTKRFDDNAMVVQSDRGPLCAYYEALGDWAYFLVEPDELVDQEYACPNCGERRMDYLIWDDDGSDVVCQTCGCIYRA